MKQWLLIRRYNIFLDPARLLIVRFLVMAVLRAPSYEIALGTSPRPPGKSTK